MVRSPATDTAPEPQVKGLADSANSASGDSPFISERSAVPVHYLNEKRKSIISKILTPPPFSISCNPRFSTREGGAKVDE
jgi:hypothetical protein